MDASPDQDSGRKRPLSPESRTFNQNPKAQANGEDGGDVEVRLAHVEGTRASPLPLDADGVKQKRRDVPASTV